MMQPAGKPRWSYTSISFQGLTLACGVWCSLVCALRKARAGNGFGNGPMEAFDLMCTATWVSPTLPEGNHFLTDRDAAQRPAVLEASPGEGVKDGDPIYAAPAILRTLLQSALYPLQTCLGDLRVWTLPVQTPNFYWARSDMSVLVLLKSGVSKRLWISGLFGL